MNQTAMNDPRLLLNALECFLPIYSRLSPGELADLFAWMNTGRTSHDLMENHTEEWLVAAYAELSTTGLLADKWLNVAIGDLYSQKLDGLDDFSLATYASAVQERDHESVDVAGSRNEWDRMCDAYQILLENQAGSVVLNYSWLYRDILNYRMSRDDQAYRQIHRLALAFEVRYGTDDSLFRALIYMISDEIQYGSMKTGVESMARIIENYPNCFDVYDTAATAFFQGKQELMGQMVLRAAESLTMDREDAHAYDDICFMYRKRRVIDQPRTPLEKRLARAFEHPVDESVRPTTRKLTGELVPGIENVPVKQFSIR